MKMFLLILLIIVAIVIAVLSYHAGTNACVAFPYPSLIVISVILLTVNLVYGAVITFLLAIISFTGLFMGLVSWSKSHADLIWRR